MSRLLSYLTLALLTLSASSAAELAPSDLLRQGLYAEEVSRDPEAAAKHYAEIIAAEDRRRATVATAVFRLAEVKRGQGKKDEAIALYQKLLREYPGAEAEGKLAREHLEKLGAKVLENGGTLVDPETVELARLQAAVNDSPDLVSDAATLASAAKKGWLKVVELLLAHGANPYHAKGKPIIAAVGEGHLAICRAMIAKAGVPPDDALQKEALDEAIDMRRWAVVRFLFENGFKADAGLSNGWHTILSQRAADEETEDSQMLLQLLIKHGADPNAVPVPDQNMGTDEPPLHGALRNGRFKHARLLLENGAKLDPDGTDDRPGVLHLALASKCPGVAAMLKDLIGRGAGVNLIRLYPQTERDRSRPVYPASPLQMAVDQRDWESAKVLIDNGADLKQPGWLANYLPERAFDGETDVEKLRISTKSSRMFMLDMSTKDEEIKTKTRERLKFLLEAGADPNQLDLRGYHPLSLVVLAGRTDLLELFLKHGADPDVPFGKDPGPLPPPPQRASAEWRNAQGLLNRGLDPYRGLETCPRDVQVAMLRLLLKAGGKPGSHTATMRKLIEGHDPDGSLARALDAPPSAETKTNPSHKP